MKHVALLLCILSLAACSDYAYDPILDNVTFEEISQPFLDQYGEPNETNQINDENLVWIWNFDTYRIEVVFSKILTTWKVYSQKKIDLPVIHTFEEVSQPYIDQYGEPVIKDERYTPSLWWHWDLNDHMLCVYLHGDYYGSWEAQESTWYTFSQISQPFLDQYGQPEEVSEYNSANYHSIDWWWWSRGFEVTFLCTAPSAALVQDWAVDSTYSFSPVY
ncbi:MAG: hypothetical protein HN350_22070 [Phycisphaerales bacterium]|jgi:hypothetical protein|nr:hypothetical protein [Phycisphaerales bacterium]